MPKLFTGLNVGAIETRHRVVMDLPYRAGLAAASELIRRSAFVRGGIVIHDLGSTGGAMSSPVADLLSRSVPSAHGLQQSVVARVRAWSENRECSAARARDRGYDGVELDLGSVVSHVPDIQTAEDRIEELLGELPPFLHRDRLGLRLSGRTRDHPSLLSALRSAGDYELAYVHLSGLPFWSLAWPASRQAADIRRAFPGILVAGGCSRLHAAVRLVQDRWADEVSAHLSIESAPDLLSELRATLAARRRGRNGPH